MIERTGKLGCCSLVLVISIFSLSVSQKNLRLANDTLAVIGSRIITAEKFARLYREKLVTVGLSDNGETRMKFLLNLVDDEILIARAKNLKLDRTRGANSERARVRLQELLNAYVRKHISSNIDVLEDELKDLFVRMNTKVKVYHLYAATRQEADSLYNKLSAGISFEELASTVFSDPKLRESGGSLGYISVDEMELEFERIAFAMNVGEISKPVKTVQGYSIIRVDDVKRNPFTTEHEYLKARERLKAFARRRKFEEAARQFTSSLRAEFQIRFDDGLLSRLYEMTRQQSWPRLIENKSLALSPKERTKGVVAWREGSWNVSELIRALSATSEKQLRWIRTKENFEDFIAGLVMREHIAQRATREKLDAAPSFRDNVEYAFDSYLLKTIEDNIRKQIRFSPDSLRSFYEQNKDRFATLPEMRLRAILVDNAILADSIPMMLERGKSFDTLAKQYSIQRPSAECGGDLGYFRMQELASLGEEIPVMRIGEWKGPIVQDGKYLFLKCTDVKPVLHRSFKESSEEVERTLIGLAWYRARSQAAESFKKKIGCRVYPEKAAAMSLSL